VLGQDPERSNDLVIGAFIDRLEPVVDQPDVDLPHTPIIPLS